jgi:hypothetical protein
VDDGYVGDGHALWQGHEDVTLSLGANGGAVGRSSCAGSEARVSAEGWFKGGGDARIFITLYVCIVSALELFV